MTTLKNSLLLLSLTMLSACHTPPRKPLAVSGAVGRAQASTTSASTDVRSAIESSHATSKEIKRIKSTQDRVDAKSILILKWLEMN